MFKFLIYIIYIIFFALSMHIVQIYEYFRNLEYEKKITILIIENALSKWFHSFKINKGILFRKPTFK